jgi:amino acid permease
MSESRPESAPLMTGANAEVTPRGGDDVYAGHTDGATGAQPQQAGPSATSVSTFINITCNIVGVGILALPLAMHNASLGFGILLTLAFLVFAVFASYVLSVACEYTQLFAQSQLLSHVLAGVTCRAENGSLAPMTGHAAAAPAAEDPELAAAEEEARTARRHVTTAIDAMLAVTYFGYLIAYARVVGDSMVNISRDLGFPAFFHERWTWLGIGGVIFGALSMRRVFHELKITSLLGITTILFVVLCVVIRFGDHRDPDMPAKATGVRDWALDSKFLAAFSTLSSAYGYQVNHPAFYQELAVRTPAAMQRPVIAAMLLVAFAYVLTGVVGYLAFGDGVATKRSGGDIVNNFNASDTLMNVARLALFVHFVSVFPIVSFAVRQCAHRAYLRVSGQHERAEDPEEVFRVPYVYVAGEALTITVLAVLLAGVVPGIGGVIDLAGCLGGTFSLMILPGIVGMCIFSEIRARRANNDESLSPRITDPALNNIAGFCQIAVSDTVNLYMSAAVLVIGVIATVGGFIVVLPEFGK